MGAIMEIMQKRTLLIFLTLIALAAVAIVVVWSRGEKKSEEETWSPPSAVPSATFHGPTGAPFIVGPKEPPPGPKR